MIEFKPWRSRKACCWPRLQAQSAFLVVVVAAAGCAPKEVAPPLDLAGAEASIRSEAEREDRETEMARVLALDPGAASAIQDAFAARDAAVEAWLTGEKGHQLIEWEARLKEAVKASKLEEVKRCTAAGKPLREEFRRLIAEHESAIMSTLSTEQQVHWQGYEVSKKLLTLMEPLGLAFEQSQAIEQAGPTAVAQAMQRGEPNPQAAAFLEVEKWAEDSVLGPEQRAGYQEIKSQNKLRSLGI